MVEEHIILIGDSVGQLLQAGAACLGEHGGTEVVFRRFFLSDVAQAAELPPMTGAVSCIVQPPLGGGSLALWMYVVRGAGVRRSGGVSIVSADGAEHIWTSGLYSSGMDSYFQTRGVFGTYTSQLEAYGCTLADDCARTWLFVDDIDHNYQGMVRARREYFESCGLTSQTHYIASTGICGRPVAAGALVQMDAYSVRGDVRKRYLYGSSHLNPTSEYGVTFERGVRLDYSGASHLLISGTASIDNRGQVMYVGDVRAQTGRMLENVGVLLSEGGCGWENLKMAVVYLRNAGDYARVMPILSEKLRGTPFTVTLAPVCRPQWLIEMECIAVK